MKWFQTLAVTNMATLSEKSTLYKTVLTFAKFEVLAALLLRIQFMASDLMKWEFVLLKTSVNEVFSLLTLLFYNSEKHLQKINLS